jgi:hypothetical protein
LEIAAEQGSELQFDRYRRELEAVDLSPALRVAYHLNVGNGYGLLNNVEAGIRHLERAIELASSHRLNQLVFEAEAALTEIRRKETKPVVHRSEFEATEFGDIVGAIESMKELAGVS